MDLFSIFDPQTFMFSMNWASASFGVILVFPVYWTVTGRISRMLSMLFEFLNFEIKLSLSPITTPVIGHLTISLFTFIAMNNFMGLMPYIFTSTSHLTFSLTFALFMWMSVISASVILNLGGFLAHLVPTGTPALLTPFMVLIELVSNLIRPLTLSVRLAANMVAGHLLICLLTSPMPTMFTPVLMLACVALVAMLMLETAVAVIQAYVFMTLTSLYLGEVNSMVAVK
uniref:ATP synthase subunit a n=1 Tax=Paracyclopina nana TaxID=565004 RepID=C0J6S6_PARNA|nr:ATP synthase F0 subunit 6 [Paracyclopina nana]